MSGSNTPILFANVWGMIPMPLQLVQRQYSDLGFDSTVIPFALDDNRCVETFADKIAEWVPRYCIEQRVSKIHLIGISLGGIGGMLAIKRRNIARYLSTFTAVSAPLLGSPLWVLAAPSLVFSRLGRQMRPYNSFLTKLSREPLPRGLPVLGVQGLHDHVCPVWSATIPGAQNLVLPFGHPGVLCNPEIPAAVAAFLKRYPP